MAYVRILFVLGVLPIVAAKEPGVQQMEVPVDVHEAQARQVEVKDELADFLNDLNLGHLIPVFVRHKARTYRPPPSS